jgi:hypothetical protein
LLKVLDFVGERAGTRTRDLLIKSHFGAVLCCRVLYCRGLETQQN